MNRQIKKVSTKKLRRSFRFLDKISPGRKLKLLKLRKKIMYGEYKYKTGLFEVFDEIINDASTNTDSE